MGKEVGSMNSVIDALSRVQQATDQWATQLSKEERDRVLAVQKIYSQQKSTNSWQGVCSGVLKGAAGLLGMAGAYYEPLKAISTLVGEGLAKVPETVFENRRVGHQADRELESRTAEMAKSMQSASQQFYAQFHQSVQTMQQTKAQEGNH